MYIKGPKQVGSCDAFSVVARATGSGGRSFIQSSWYLELNAHSPEAGYYNTLLSNITSLRLTVPSSFLAPGYNYTLVFNTTNFFGRSGSAKLVIARSSYHDVT